MVGKIEAILQTKMNMTYADIKSLSHEELCYEWSKYQWVAEQEAKAMKEIKSN